MSKRIALIHALTEAVDPITQAFLKEWPEADRVHILDDSLSRDRRKFRDLTPDMYRRFAELSSYAQQIGSDAILFTCSAFGEAIETAARTVRIPVLKPNEAMFEEALQYGKIGMLATFAPSIVPMEQEFNDLAKLSGSSAEIRTLCIPEAMDALKDGDAERHNTLVADRAPELAGSGAILLAQFSTSRAQQAVAARVTVPVLTSPVAAIRKLRRLLQA